MDTLISAISALLAAVAIVVGLRVNQKLVKQTDALHLADQTLATRTFIESQFRAVFDAIDKLLRDVADVKASIHPYFKYSDEALIEAGAGLVEHEKETHRAIYRMRASGKELDFALASLRAVPKTSNQCSKFLAEITLASSFMDSSTMAVYHTLITRAIKDEANASDNYFRVYRSVQRYWDEDAGASMKEERIAFLRGHFEEWIQEASKRTDAKSAPDVSSIAFSILERTEDIVGNSARGLYQEYTKVQMESLEHQKLDRPGESPNEGWKLRT